MRIIEVHRHQPPPPDPKFEEDGEEEEGNQKQNKHRRLESYVLPYVGVCVCTSLPVLPPSPSGTKPTPPFPIPSVLHDRGVSHDWGF
jgi:hypothetical protein